MQKASILIEVRATDIELLEAVRCEKPIMVVTTDVAIKDETADRIAFIFRKPNDPEADSCCSS